MSLSHTHTRKHSHTRTHTQSPTHTDIRKINRREHGSETANRRESEREPSNIKQSLRLHYECLWVMRARPRGVDFGPADFSPASVPLPLLSEWTTTSHWKERKGPPNCSPHWKNSKHLKGSHRSSCQTNMTPRKRGRHVDYRTQSRPACNSPIQKIQKKRKQIMLFTGHALLWYSRTFRTSRLFLNNIKTDMTCSNYQTKRDW